MAILKGLLLFYRSVASRVASVTLHVASTTTTVDTVTQVSSGVDKASCVCTVSARR